MTARKLVKKIAMAEHPTIFEVLRDDPRYKIEAYQFVREALSFAQKQSDMKDALSDQSDQHLTGQQLCEASRLYAIEQYGLMARTVLKSWGIQRTDDLGEIVYNLIRINLMKKSENDRREDFDAVFDFEKGLDSAFEFTAPDEIEL